MATFSDTSQDLLDARDAVASRFGLSTDLVSESWSTATDLLESMAAFANVEAPEAISDTIFDLTDPYVGEQPTAEKPEAYESQLADVVMTSLAELKSQLGNTELSFASVDMPVLEAVRPNYTSYEAPTDETPNFDDEVPSTTEPNLPVAPDEPLPTPPTFNEVTLPTAPPIGFASFDATLPTQDLTPPDPMFVFTEVAYNSELAEALKAKLLSDIQNGGTGLGADVEAAIWARAQDRVSDETEARYEEVEAFGTSLGDDLPPGVLGARLMQAGLEHVNKLAQLNYEISIEQARLAQNNTQFTVTQTIAYEQILMDLANKVQQRAFEAAKAVVEMAVAVYNVKVLAYQAQLEKYKTEAAVFESMIRAELAKIEIYKAQIEGARMTVEIQSQYVEIYKARLGAVGVLIDLYNAQMEGAKIQLEIDKNKIDVFRAKIEGKSAQVAGITAKYNLYQAQLAGEKTKADIYKTDVDAYSQLVGAAKTEADVNVAELQARLQINQDNIRVLEAALDKYKTDVQAETQAEETRVKVYDAQTRAYEVDRKALSEWASNTVEAYKAKVQQIATEADIRIKEAANAVQVALGNQNTATAITEAGARIAAQMSASALTSVSASAQIGYNASNSESKSQSESDSNVNSFSVSYSNSESDSTSYSEAHIYNEES